MIQLAKAQSAAIRAARTVGGLLRRNLSAQKRTHAVFSHDIKLKLDLQAQAMIEKSLGRAFPEIAFLGEEGTTGNLQAEYRWVVDPIDGTVNFAYGIPHACVSIALQRRAKKGAKFAYEDGYQTVMGVVHGPFCDELWTAIRGGKTRLNDKIVRVTKRADLADTIVGTGSPNAKEREGQFLRRMCQLIPRVRKVRMMGSATLALCYVASGRYDGFVEGGLNLWDIAAGGILVEGAGGVFSQKKEPGLTTYFVVASNEALQKKWRACG